MTTHSNPPDFSGFSPASLADWEKAALRELKGKTIDSILYEAEPGLRCPPYAEIKAEDTFRIPGTGPAITTQLSLDPRIHAQLNLDELAAGAENLEFSILYSADMDFSALNALLDKVPASAKVCIEGDAALLPVYQKLLNETTHRPRAMLNPFQFSFSGGWSPLPENTLSQWSAFSGSDTLFLLDAGEFEQAGASPSTQIALLLAMAASLAENESAKRLSKCVLRMNTGPVFLTEIAKFRALRRLLPAFVSAYDHVDAENISVSAGSSSRLISRVDVHTNLIRLTTATLSAMLGMANPIRISPFRNSKGADAAFPLRMSRNIALLLRHESFIGNVKDPVAGSASLDALCDSLAARAWDTFLEIQKLGGFLSVMQSGWIQTRIQQEAESANQAVRTREALIVGVNEFPSGKDEFLVPFESLPEWKPAPGREKVFPVPVIADARMEFEALRIAAEDHWKSTGERARLVLLTFGEPLMRNARAVFSRNFFGLLGLQGEEIMLTENESETVKQLESAKCDILVFCAADADYAAKGMELAKQLRAAMPGCMLVLAGKPQDEGAMRAYGFSHFIYRKMDAPAVLGAIFRDCQRKGAAQ